MNWQRPLIGAAAAALVLGGVAAVAVPSWGAVGSTAAPAAAVVQAGHQFYTDDQIDQAWKATTESFPQPLPTGVTFPSSAPGFFHPNDGKKHIFETSLPTQLAARYWRCAWLDVSLKSAPGDSKLATIKSRATDQLSKFASIPDVASNLDVSSYEQGMSDYAKTIGVNEQQAEFNVDCGIYTGEAAK